MRDNFRSKYFHSAWASRPKVYVECCGSHIKQETWLLGYQCLLRSIDGSAVVWMQLAKSWIRLIAGVILKTALLPRQVLSLRPERCWMIVVTKIKGGGQHWQTSGSAHSSENKTQIVTLWHRFHHVALCFSITFNTFQRLLTTSFPETHFSFLQYLSLSLPLT